MHVLDNSFAIEAGARYRSYMFPREAAAMRERERDAP